MKGTLDDDVTEADIISCVEFNQDGELLATGDKGGRVVIFQVKHFIIQMKKYFQFNSVEGCRLQEQCAQAGGVQRLLNISVS